MAKKKAKKKATKKKSKQRAKKKKRQRNNLVRSPLFLIVVRFRRPTDRSRLVKRGPICIPAPIGLRLTPNWCGKNGNQAAMQNIQTAASYSKMEDSFRDEGIFHFYLYPSCLYQRPRVNCLATGLKSTFILSFPNDSVLANFGYLIILL